MDKTSSCSSKFVGHKIRKIRWCPANKNSLQSPNAFVTGSWDDPENKICVYSVPHLNTSEEQDLDPRLECEVNHVGDVTEIKFFDSDTLVAGSSMGSVAVYQRDDKLLVKKQEWLNIHKFPSQGSRLHCPCTSLDVQGDEIVSVGEDGKIVVLKTKQPQATRVLEGSDICSINAVMFMKPFEVITANMRGQLKVWDLRSSGAEPAQNFSVSGDCVSSQCLCQHPHQPQIFASGGEDGTLYIWDTRQEKYPVSVLNAHSSTMLEVKFHPHNPNHLFTCSDDASVWHWDSSGINQTPVSLQLSKAAKATDVFPELNPWTACGAAKHRLEICSLLPMSFLPINSLDIESTTLICGSDMEAVYVIPNVIEM